MPTGLTYDTYKVQLAQLTVIDPADANFLAILPMVIDYAEQRIYRDLDLLSAQQSTTSNTTTTGARELTFPISSFVVLQQVNIITPAGTTDPKLGERVPLLPTTKEFLDTVYPSAASSAMPEYFAMLTQNKIAFGPWPDASYTAELVGTYRPETLSASNNTTFISQYLDDLFLMASMVYVSGYQRNFGKQSDSPDMAVSYESQYQTLAKAANTEEQRKRLQAAAWTAQAPATVATPTR